MIRPKDILSYFIIARKGDNSLVVEECENGLSITIKGRDAVKKLKRAIQYNKREANDPCMIGRRRSLRLWFKRIGMNRGERTV